MHFVNFKGFWILPEMEVSFLTAILENSIEDGHEMLWRGELSSTIERKKNALENWKKYYECKLITLLLRLLSHYLIIHSNSAPSVKFILFFSRRALIVLTNATFVLSEDELVLKWLLVAKKILSFLKLNWTAYCHYCGSTSGTSKLPLFRKVYLRKKIKLIDVMLSSTNTVRAITSREENWWKFSVVIIHDVTGFKKIVSIFLD